MKTKNYIRFQNNEAEWITTKEEKQAYDGWIKLPRIEYKIFKALMEKRFELIPMLDLIVKIRAEVGEPISHTELTQDARGIFIQNSFRVHLSNLRKAIQKTGITIPTKDGKLVLTIPEWKPAPGLYIGLQQHANKEILKRADCIGTVDPINENMEDNKITIHVRKDRLDGEKCNHCGEDHSYIYPCPTKE